MNEQDLKTTALTVKEKATSLIISTEADYSNAGEFLKLIKTNTKTVQNFFEEIKNNAYASWKAICNKETDLTKPLQEAESIVKKGMANFAMEQEKIKHEKEAELRRIQAEMARKEAERAAELETQGKTEEAEIAFETALQIEDLKPAVIANANKVEGVSFSVDWEVAVMNEDVVPVSLNGVILRPVDVGAIKRLVKLAKGKIDILGVKITETKNMRVRT
jgi:hypothetical protein